MPLLPLRSGPALAGDSPPGKKQAAPAKEAAGSGERLLFRMAPDRVQGRNGLAERIVRAAHGPLCLLHRHPHRLAKGLAGRGAALLGICFSPRRAGNGSGVGRCRGVSGSDPQGDVRPAHMPQRPAKLPPVPQIPRPFEHVPHLIHAQILRSAEIGRRSVAAQSRRSRENDETEAEQWLHVRQM